VVPAGASELEFRYEPNSLKWGLRLAGIAVAALIAWIVILWRKPGAASPRDVPVCEARAA
jgi:hypothetical protein